jgi:hypothetical protein
MGVRTEDPTIRRLAIAPYPYLIFYEIAESEIIIHAVRQERAIRGACRARQMKEGEAVGVN